jgi:hypothetical protein
VSVSASEPVRAPTVAGAKLIGNWQEAPAASVPAVEELALTSGQAKEPLLFSVKFPAILGLLPLDGIGKVNAALPTFSTVTVCGSPVEPTAMAAKLKLGESMKSSFTTLLFS